MWHFTKRRKKGNKLLYQVPSLKFPSFGCQIRLRITSSPGISKASDRSCNGVELGTFGSATISIFADYFCASEITIEKLEAGIVLENKNVKGKGVKQEKIDKKKEKTKQQEEDGIVTWTRHVSSDRNSEEFDSWMPPAGQRFDYDDIGDSWASDSSTFAQNSKGFRMVM